MREEVRDVLPGTVPQDGRPGGAKLLTVEQLAALEKASAAAGRGDAKAHKTKVCMRSDRRQLSRVQQVCMPHLMSGVQVGVWGAVLPAFTVIHF